MVWYSCWYDARELAGSDLPQRSQCWPHAGVRGALLGLWHLLKLSAELLIAHKGTQGSSLYYLVFFFDQLFCGIQTYEQGGTVLPLTGDQVRVSHTAGEAGHCCILTQKYVLWYQKGLTISQILFSLKAESIRPQRVPRSPPALQTRTAAPCTGPTGHFMDNFNFILILHEWYPCHFHHQFFYFF